MAARPQPPAFTPADLAEAARLNARLDKLPRFRMQTTGGRWFLNLLLRAIELVPSRPARDRRARRELRRVAHRGHEVAVRLWRPRHPPRGVVIEIHGGGWTIGNARENDGRNARLAIEAGLAVVSVDYRLAVHHGLGELVDDCETAMLWTVEHAAAEFGTSEILLQAESAGSHLAALALLRLRDRHGLAGRIRAARLSFGLYDMAGTHAVREAGSRILLLHGPTIRTTLCKLTPDMTDAQRRSPALSPLHADLSGLPPALFTVGALDVLLEDNERMAARWRAASGNSELFVVPQTPHAIFRLPTAIARKAEAYGRAWMLAHLQP